MRKYEVMLNVEKPISMDDPKDAFREKIIIWADYITIQRGIVCFHGGNEIEACVKEFIYIQEVGNTEGK